MAMGFYQYKAMDADGRIQTGRTDAGNIADLEMRLQKMGLDLINCKQIRTMAGVFAGGVGRRDLILFCFHLEQTAKAGVPILDSLVDLRDSTENRRLREVVSAMIESIEGGRTLSQSMQDFPAVFSTLFASLIHAGEQSGQLGIVLGKLADNLKFQDEQAAMTRRLLAYPLFVSMVLVGMVFFLMTYLVPALLGFVTTMGHELPLHTRALIATSDVFVNYWWALLLIPAGSTAGLMILTRISPAVSLAIDRSKLRMPLLGPVLKKIILARLAEFFAMMYSSGITVLDCIHTGEQIAGNKAVAAAMYEVGQQIADGRSLSEGFESTGLFPPLVMRMIKIGEATGKLESSLDNVSYFYTRDIRESLARLQAIIEPAMTIMLGVLIGWVMLSVLGPVYDIISTIRV